MPSEQAARDPIQQAIMSLPPGLSDLQDSLAQALHPSSQSMFSHHQVAAPSSFGMASHPWPQPLAAPQPHNGSISAYQQQLQRPFQPAGQWDPFAALNTNDRVLHLNEFARGDPGSRGNLLQASSATGSQAFDMLSRGPTSQSLQGFPLGASHDSRPLSEENQSLLHQYMMITGLLPSSQQQQQQERQLQQQQQQEMLAAVGQQQPTAEPPLVRANLTPQHWSASSQKIKLDKEVDVSKSTAAVLARRNAKAAVDGAGSSGSVQVRVRQRRRYRHENFPSKLYRILMEVESDHGQDIVSFTYSGNAFAIHNADKFTKLVLPKYFRHGRMASFKRQLSMYGFRRLTSGPEEGAFHHELFRKGRPELCEQLKRVTEFEVVPEGEGEEEQDHDSVPNH